MVLVLQIIESTQYIMPLQDEEIVRGADFESCNEKHEFVDALKVLHPDDPLMKRFQDALKTHLIKVNEKLTKECDELTIANKQAKKERLQKGNRLYDAQLEITKQVALIEKWNMSVEAIKCWREEESNNLKNMRTARNIVQQEFNKERQVAESMSHEINSISSLCRRLAEYENEVCEHLAIAKRMSEKDASVQRELIRHKQEMDYIMLNACDIVWKLEKDMEDLQQQIKLKNDEKMTMGQTIADANADLQVLEGEQKNLINSWNKVILSIQQRDRIYDNLLTQRMNSRESLKRIHTQIEKIKKNTKNEMENNEQFTAIHEKLIENIFHNEEAIKVYNDRYQVVQYKSDSMIKLTEYTEGQFLAANSEYRQLINEENILIRELEKLTMLKNTLEDEVMIKLDDKTTQNKTLRHLNKTLRDKRETIKQLELTMLQTENQYGKNLLEVKKLNNIVSIEERELMEFIQINNGKNDELNKLYTEIEKCNLLIEKKQRTIDEFNKRIDEICGNMSGNVTDMLAPHIIKIASLEKSIEELEVKNNENQRDWLRQEAVIINLCDERNDKLHEINRLSKQVIIIQQKNLKLVNALDKENKIEQNINRQMNELHQRLLKTNTILAGQKEIKNQLKDKNFVAKDEYTRALQHAEQEFINFQNNIKDLSSERCVLEEKLRDENRNNVSWDKKLKFAIETIKIIKQEQNYGGDIAVMRSEIRKMEMRLAYLKKIQEKMIRDMEYCVTRREIIVDAALTKQMKNPKVMHNKRVMFEKRMSGRRFEIKNMNKIMKSIEDKMSKVKKESQILEYEEMENRKLLKNHQDELLDLSKQIFDCEIIRHHKLECLVRKQRKIKLLQDVRDGKYKIICKSIATINDELDKQSILNGDLIEIMEQTNQDFPLFKDDIRKIFLTLQPN